MLLESYISSANTLRERVFALILTHPEIMDMNNAFDLIKIEEFMYKDMQPSLAQVEGALDSAKELYRKENDAK